MIKKILLGIAAIIAVFAVYVALQPADFRFERSVTVAAPAPVVFDNVNNLKKWDHWSPWAKLDPDAKVQFAGPEAGEGAAFMWSGNDKIGEGKMTVVESKPAEKVGIRLDFVKPFEATGKSEFYFKPSGNQTQVTWAFSGENNFITRAICIIVNMQGQMESTMDKGLASMKQVAEAAK